MRLDLESVFCLFIGVSIGLLVFGLKEGLFILEGLFVFGLKEGETVANFSVGHACGLKSFVSRLGFKLSGL